MKFRRYQGHFFVGYTIVMLIGLFFMIFMSLAFISGDKTEFVSKFVAFFVYCCCETLLYAVTYRYYMEDISLSKEGVVLSNRKGIIQHLDWNNVGKIIRSRYLGINTLVVISRTGEDIWFCESKKAKSYIFSVCPRMENLFVEDREPWKHKSTKQKQSNPSGY